MDAVRTLFKKPYPASNKRNTLLLEPNSNETQKSSVFSSGLTSSLTTLFDYLRWCFIVPYKIQYSDQTSTYEVTVNDRRKVFIWILQLVIIVHQSVMVIYRFRYANSLPSVIRAMINFALACWSNVTLTMLWRHRKAFAAIMSRLADISLKLEMRGAQLTRRTVAVAVVTAASWACVILAFLEVVYYSLKLSAYRESGYTNMKPLDLLIEQATAVRIHFPELKKSEFGTVLLLIIGFGEFSINRIYNFSIGHFGYAVLYILCVTVGKLYQALISTVPAEMSSKAEIDDAINLYSEIRSITAVVNKTIGSMMACGILVHLPYNAYKVNDLLDGSSFTQAMYIIHIVMYLAILFAGAKVHSQISSFADKLACHKLVLQDTTLQGTVALLVQQSRLAGMRGGGVFLITYGFLGNIIGVILTYAILIVQLKQRQ